MSSFLDIYPEYIPWLQKELRREWATPLRTPRETSQAFQAWGGGRTQGVVSDSAILDLRRRMREHGYEPSKSAWHEAQNRYFGK